MDINKLKRANFLATWLLPKVDELLNMPKSSFSKVADSIYGLSYGDEEFKTKFMQLLKETKERLQKEFDELYTLSLQQGEETKTNKL